MCKCTKSARTNHVPGTWSVQVVGKCFGILNTTAEKWRVQGLIPVLRRGYYFKCDARGVLAIGALAQLRRLQVPMTHLKAIVAFLRQATPDELLDSIQQGRFLLVATEGSACLVADMQEAVSGVHFPACVVSVDIAEIWSHARCRLPASTCKACEACHTEAGE